MNLIVVWIEEVQSGAGITRSNIALYCIYHCSDRSRISIRIWIHIRHVLWGMFCDYFEEKRPRYIVTSLYFCWRTPTSDVIHAACGHELKTGARVSDVVDSTTPNTKVTVGRLQNVTNFQMLWFTFSEKNGGITIWQNKCNKCFNHYYWCGLVKMKDMHIIEAVWCTYTSVN